MKNFILRNASSAWPKESEGQTYIRDVTTPLLPPHDIFCLFILYYRPNTQLCAVDKVFLPVQSSYPSMNTG